MKKILSIFIAAALFFAIGIEGASAKSDYVKRDSLGRVILKIEYYKNGKAKEKETYAYFKNTKHVYVEKEWKYTSEGKKRYYQYEKNRLYWDKEDREYDTDEIKEIKISYYKNLKTKKYSYATWDKNGKRAKKILRSYTSKGKKKSCSKYYYKKGVTHNIKKYTYNRAGQLKSNKKYGKAKRVEYRYKSGHQVKTIVKYYNSRGKLI